ncbi:MAG: carbon monoxide dehydrogenase subunit G [Actinobacteria bacterium]|nr:carbon monoxide dehydrogenase subunit G [Actinomycetota bacterium]
MKVAGEAVLHAPVERVWTALRDPAVLVATIPGCERLVSTGPDSFDMTVTAGVASIKGSYTGTVSLADLPQPNTFLMKASGAGGPGTVSADVTVTLAEAAEEAGATRLSYHAEAVVGGVIGGVGQRMLVGVAKKLAGEFFSAVDDVLTGARPVARADTVAEPAGMPVVYRDLAVPGRVTTGTGGPIQFILGAVFGAATALAGVLVGVRVAQGGRR